VQVVTQDEPAQALGLKAEQDGGTVDGDESARLGRV
jgi:hypothetical protein